MLASLDEERTEYLDTNDTNGRGALRVEEERSPVRSELRKRWLVGH